MKGKKITGMKKTCVKSALNFHPQGGMIEKGTEKAFIYS